ncbi:hypothetical protein EYC98_14590 [Halieaceae bacterium IMCC14734]|uniref:Uncharacterized protein n=1 Tax=Candidatus Litorirhabdus singularis TaxID=2518993 RepID=A0ABT3TII3_9GAMM|nr:hypothetical protein [Candidatus Litorirhabdus singularis]MCX2982086.1 hypothetical protein [Candidatus Litorirhabdus singularis]
MSQYEQHSMPQEKFLTVANNVIHQSLLEAQRTSAKNIFNALMDKKRVALITLRMEDGSESRFDLMLDHSEFRGKLNFGSFRASVQSLVASVSDLLRDEKQLTTFKDQDSSAVLFGIPGFTEEEGELNAMMLASTTDVPGTVLLKLQYMDPAQFLEQPAGS